MSLLIESLESEVAGLREQLAAAQGHAERLRAQLEACRDFLERRRLGHTAGLLLTDIKEALAAPSGQRSPWLPIESAPKDGTGILLYAPVQEFEGKPTKERITLGCWLVLEYGEYSGDCGGECRCPQYDEPPEPYWHSEDGGFTEANPPTHWMPLPSAPETIAQEGGL